MNKHKQKNWWVYLVLFSGILFMFIPLLVTIISSFKPTKEITGNFFGLPQEFTLSNYERLFNDGIVQYFSNSAIITIVSIALILLVIPMAAFAVARQMKRQTVFNFIYFFLIIGIFVPFQVIMLPMTKLMSSLGLNNVVGLIILYLTYAVPQALFLYVGYIKTIVPEEMDVAAISLPCIGKLFSL